MSKYIRDESLVEFSQDNNERSFDVLSKMDSDWFPKCQIVGVSGRNRCRRLRNVYVTWRFTRRRSCSNKLRFSPSTSSLLSRCYILFLLASDRYLKVDDHKVQWFDRFWAKDERKAKFISFKRFHFSIIICLVQANQSEDIHKLAVGNLWSIKNTYRETHFPDWRHLNN